jgi:hypothetical protein
VFLLLIHLVDIGLVEVVVELTQDILLPLDKVDLVVVVEETYGQTQDLVKCLRLLTLVVEAAVVLPMKMVLLVVVLVVRVLLSYDI